MDEFTKRRVANIGPKYGRFDLTDIPYEVHTLAEPYRRAVASGGCVMRFYHPDGVRKGVAAIIPVGRCYIIAHVRGVSLTHAVETFQAFIGADVKRALPDGFLVGLRPDIDALPPCRIEPTDCNDHCSDCENWDCKVNHEG